jgi:putative chitinase
MDTKKFYDYIRTNLFGGQLKPSQFDGISSILGECQLAGVTDNRWIAYILATAFHETAKTMQPIEEYGKGKNYDYGKKLDIGKGVGKRVPYSTPDKLYYGRGYCQITWRSNYANMTKLLKVDLINYPELALDKKIAAKILIEGMTKGHSGWGDFTGKSLEDYFNTKITDWVNARKIINGLDKSELIAGYAKKFFEALG